MLLTGWDTQLQGLMITEACIDRLCGKLTTYTLLCYAAVFGWHAGLKLQWNELCCAGWVQFDQYRCLPSSRWHEWMMFIIIQVTVSVSWPDRSYTEKEVSRQCSMNYCVYHERSGGESWGIGINVLTHCFEHFWVGADGVSGHVLRATQIVHR